MQGKSLENVFIVRVSNLPKSGKNRQRYKNPISLYYLSDVGVSLQATPLLDLPKLAKLPQTKFVLGVPRMETL